MHIVNGISTGGSRLSRIFWEHENLSSLSIIRLIQIIIISLIIQRNLATKIRAKQESSLTAVRLKWDPPVTNFIENISKNP